ncbi:MAG: hypothetical protein U1F09_09360 [Steroidobacteraceae bacterium]
MSTRAAIVGTALLVASVTAAGCPLCIGTAARSSSQDLDELSHAVLAVPDGKQYRVVAVIKGDAPAGPITQVVGHDPTLAGRLLLVRDEQWPMWISLGQLGAAETPALRVLAAERPAEADAAAWQRRLDVAVPQLVSREPLMAELAYGACASAPYAALRAARDDLDVATVRALAADPASGRRRSLYVLLLGIAGNAQDAASLETQIEAAWTAHATTDLSSLLAADLELRGATRVDWIEEKYLRDPSRTVAEIQAALLALSVQAKSRGPVPRERVIEADMAFIAAHPDMAGFVAADLATWGYWEAAPEFASILKTNIRQHDDSRAAMVAYLRQSPLQWSE